MYAHNGDIFSQYETKTAVVLKVVYHMEAMNE